MTINDQIRDEKLQYDIDRKAAEISALSSGKIHKYEYVTGEDILSSNQQQIIEQARFTYSPFGKAFEKQIKTNKDKGQKQIDTLESLKTKAITCKSDDDNTPISKEIYDEILEERMDKILEMSTEISYSNLVYDFKGSTPSINFAIFGFPMYTYTQLKNGEKTLQQVEEEQKCFKKNLNEITLGNPKHKSEKRSYTIENVRDLYYSRQKLIHLLNDNAKIIRLKDLKPFTNQKEQDLKY